MWSEPRNFVGSDFVIPKAGTGVGGGTLTWLGVAPRFFREDFRTLSTEGVGIFPFAATRRQRAQSVCPHVTLSERSGSGKLGRTRSGRQSLRGNG
jgi:hypothetical protein